PFEPAKPGIRFKGQPLTIAIIKKPLQGEAKEWKGIYVGTRGAQEHVVKVLLLAFFEDQSGCRGGASYDLPQHVRPGNRHVEGGACVLQRQKVRIAHECPV